MGFQRCIICFIMLITASVLLFAGVGAVEFNGTVYDINGNALANASVNVTVRSMTDWSIVGYNSTTTNESGWFNLTLSDVATQMFAPQISHVNSSISTRNYSDYVGQSLPAFPAFVYNTLGSPSYYLREAGSFNLTAINSSGGRTAFNYQIKDTILGYPIAESFNWASGGVREAVVVVPADRNYSIMLYPNQSLPVSFEWNNFTSRATYNLTTPASGLNISHYNGTTRTVNKQFNISMSLPRVTGIANFTAAINVTGLDNLSVIAYLMESGNMIHATYGGMPYNMSVFGGSGDFFHANNGTYNITLPASAETTTYMLFATGRNGTNYLGAFANLTIQYGAAPVYLNFTMQGLLGNLSYIGLDNAENFATKQLVASARQSFQLINKSNHSLSQAFAHIEVTVNYSSWGVPEFTWMEEVQQSGNGNFSLPLLNVTGIKEMNVFVGGGNYAPRRIAPRVDQILGGRHLQGGTNNNLSIYNISINTFSAGDIDGQMVASNISMALYKSNSSCDVPSPASNCLIGGSGQNMSNFNPMGAIIGGGKLSFRMGTGNISVHYVNVDMMASGPPEALFDDSATDRTSGSSFDQAVRFGSGGPTIYDFVLVSIPYSEAAGSGLNDGNDVNMTIPILYDDNWNVMWNTTANGTVAGALANNFSHYVARQSEWGYLLGQTNCTTTISEFNATRPCYIDKTGNVIWIRLPHFSGTGPSVIGTTVAAASTTTTTTSGGGGGGTVSSTSMWKQTLSITAVQSSEGYTVALAEKSRVKLTIEGQEHYVGVISIGTTSAMIQIASTPQNITLNVGETKKFEVNNDTFYDLQVTLNSINASKANLTILSIHEAKSPVAQKAEEQNASAKQEESESSAGAESIKSKKEASSRIIWIVIAVLVILALVFLLTRKKK